MCELAPEDLVKLKRINVWLWQYPRNRRNMGDLCFTATPNGCRSMAGIMRLLVEGVLPRKSLDLPTLTEDDADCISYERPFINYDRLTLTFDEDATGPAAFVVAKGSKQVHVTLSPNGIASLTQMLDEVSGGRGDFTVPIIINGRPGTVFYWPCMGHLYKIREPEHPFPE